MLGQEQDTVGGLFDAKQSFKGMLSNVNMWDHVLKETEIKEMSKSCQLDEWNDGNVLRWSEFLKEGGAKLVQPSSCKPVEMGRLHFNDEYLINISQFIIINVQ